MIIDDPNAIPLGTEVYHIIHNKPVTGTISCQFIDIEVGMDYQFTSCVAYSVKSDFGFNFVPSKQVFLSLKDATNYINKRRRSESK